eukprot:7768843-Prorocentrum_lima.AAC.1
MVVGVSVKREKTWADCCKDEAFGEEEEKGVTALKEKCKGYLHTRGCEKCKNALGHMRVHTH